MTRCLSMAHVGATLGCFLLLNGCGDSPVAPTDPHVGAWSGAIVDEALGSGTLQLVVPASGQGSWSASFGSPPTITTGSWVAVRTNPATFDVPFDCQPGIGSLNLHLEGGRLVGTYVAFGCATLTRGTINVGK